MNEYPTIMKRITILFSVLVLAILPLFSQNVSIPDANFLAHLIKMGVDTNEDGQISYEEAEEVTKLHAIFLYPPIYDITGIEAFINLDTLSLISQAIDSIDISSNTKLKLVQILRGPNGPGGTLKWFKASDNPAVEWLTLLEQKLVTLDLTNLPALEILNCTDNQLTELDLSNNLLLRELNCVGNQLTELDLSANTSLELLTCYYNPLTQLDVSNNLLLRGLSCGDNLLTLLDLSANRNLGLDSEFNWEFALSVNDMPTLEKICVWELPVPFKYSIRGCPNAYFSTECTTSIEDDNHSIELIYPNPTSGTITIDIQNPLNADIEIYNINGNLIYSKPLHSTQQQIDLSAYPKGLYFVKVRQQGMVKVGKVVLE